VAARLAVDPQRVYLAGMSGGVRVALGIALASKDIAGVIASSGGRSVGQAAGSSQSVMPVRINP